VIIRSKDPQVEEFEFEALDGVITPNDKFYIRNHFPEPNISRDSWVLRVEGAIANPLELNYEALLKMPHATVKATLECAGNNRIFLNPPAKGVQWALGGASTAEWTGVCLADVLNQAGLKPEAVDVMFEGADCGPVELEPKPIGDIYYARSLPVSKALDPDVLLVFQMNGEELSVSHGFPLRVIVPGWYAMASVKWLNRIIVSDRPFNGYFQTTDYAFWEHRDGQPVRVPISNALVKAEIARPQMNEVIPQNTTYRIFGAGWVGEANLARVEVSTDDGHSWSEARLLGEAIRNAWRLWEFDWQTPSSPQTCKIMARATDDKGNTQAIKHDPDRGDYMINHCLPMVVKIGN